MITLVCFVMIVLLMAIYYFAHILSAGITMYAVPTVVVVLVFLTFLINRVEEVRVAIREQTETQKQLTAALARQQRREQPK